MNINTKSTGNKAEIVIISEFIKNDIPVSLPFGGIHRIQKYAPVWYQPKGE